MDCTSYYCGSISSSLTSYIDESDSHTLITDECATRPPALTTPHTIHTHSTRSNPPRVRPHVQQPWSHLPFCCAYEQAKQLLSTRATATSTQL
eukprot:COSAG02_NODE_1714_length_11220_cov_3.198543_9_plen_93_part_00